MQTCVNGRIEELNEDLAAFQSLLRGISLRSSWDSRAKQSLRESERPNGRGGARVPKFDSGQRCVVVHTDAFKSRGCFLLFLK